MGWIRTAKLKYPVNNNIVTTTLEEIETGLEDETDLDETSLENETSLEYKEDIGGDLDEGLTSSAERNIYSNRASHRGD